MVKIKLKNGEILEFPKGIAVADVAKHLGMGIYRAACSGKLNGEIVDLRTPILQDSSLFILTFQDEEGKKAYWHTAAHVLAQAVKRLFPSAKLAIGPAIERGFYYDFDFERSFNATDLEKIEAEMKKIIKDNLPIERFELEKEEALELYFSSDAMNSFYKIELIKEHAIKFSKLSFYRQGEFFDLCAGPHLLSTGCLKSIKLTSCTGAYWKGNSKNKMLQRIYGIAFPKAAELEAYILAISEAKKRDHNKIGRELEFFTTSEYIGQGLPIFMPGGAKVLQILQRFVEDEEEKRGYLLTKTPFMAKSDLYKISGHWDHYKDGMFVIGDESEKNEIFALRPMTCPFQFQVYLNKPRSYKDLPMRFNETSTLFRNESSGEMHGLIRIKQFTLSEGHIICEPSQLEKEFLDCLELAGFMLKTLGLDEDVFYRFSKWDKNNREKYIGDATTWENVQDKMRNILDALNLNYLEIEGEAAFYGPKLDIQIKNVHGKEDTLITIQIDFQLAERFNMTYIAADGKKKYPYIIHRSSIGCYERTLALLIEKYAGALPLWLMPEQVRVLPISEKMHNFAIELEKSIKAAGIRSTCDLRNEKIGFKIRDAQVVKIPYMLVIGEKEMTEGSVSVRKRRGGDVGCMKIEDFIERVLEEDRSKILYEKE
ncbi:MAG: threonine--tRNA ligase [Oscillospiraceae bacterium]|nr:threonine--tRNA ligase [Oscillospiraceae bacterium]